MNPMTDYYNTLAIRRMEDRLSEPPDFWDDEGPTREEYDFRLELMIEGAEEERRLGLL